MCLFNAFRFYKFTVAVSCHTNIIAGDSFWAGKTPQREE